MKKLDIYCLARILAALVLLCSAKAVESEAAQGGEGPFLGNATRNSWADQDSIVIWTRTTARAEFMANGKTFVDRSPKELAEISKHPHSTRQA